MTTEQLQTLAPCPHCGTPGAYRTDTWGGKTRYRTVCPNKECEVGCKFFTSAQAAMHWNRRADAHGVPGRVEGKAE